MTPSPESKTCPACGNAIPADSPGGWCPACLMDKLLGEGVQVDPSSADTVIHPTTPSSVRVAPHERASDRIDRYKLLQEIGTGGFGSVWMAEQEEPVRRRVALKIIKLGMDTKNVIARFEAERQALAMMDHPNIAKVFDAGATASGRPYFVMELVRGIPITQYCDENNLPAPQRLALFIAVCHAIQHAHQKGIIHRDIKPSNILVTLHDGVPVPKVIDFGIAKATEARLTDRTLFTELHAFVGTPAYMSPEQAEMSGLDIDTRADIYSLGVLLYELLSGRLPFDPKELLKAGLDEIRRTIREVEPPRPSTRLGTMTAVERTAIAKQRGLDPAQLSSLLRGDLDWIVMKTLEKDRTRRYETANGLALDLQRYLDNEAVLARPPSTAYLIGKLIRRHKTAFAAASAVMLALIAGVAVTTWQAIRATKAEHLAQLRLAETASERDEKEAALRIAKRNSAILYEVFQGPRTHGDGRSVTIAEKLDQAVKRLDKEDFHSDPFERTMLQMTLARTYAALGLYREAIMLQKKIRDYYVNRIGLAHPTTLQSIRDLAAYHEGAGMQREALALRQATLHLLRKHNGKVDREKALLMLELALNHQQSGSGDQGISLLEEALATCREALPKQDPVIAPLMYTLAWMYENGNRADAAEKIRADLKEIWRKELRLSDDDSFEKFIWRLDEKLLELGFDYESRLVANLDIKKNEEGLSRLRERLGRDHPACTVPLENLAFDYERSGLLDDAVKMREEVLRIRRKTSGGTNEATLGAMRQLAATLQKAGRKLEALNLSDEVLTALTEKLGFAHQDTMLAMAGHADLLCSAGRERDALPLLRRCNESAPDDTRRAMKLAALLVWFGEFGEHAALCARMATWADKIESPEAAERVAKLCCLRTLDNASQIQEAVNLAQRACDRGRQHQYSRYFQMALGMAQYRAGRFEECVAQLEALAHDKSPVGVIRVTSSIFQSMALFGLGRKELAGDILQKARAVMRPLPEDDRHPLVEQSTSADDLIIWLAYKEACALEKGSSNTSK